MNIPEQALPPRAVFQFIDVAGDAPFLRGSRCDACGAVLLGIPVTCAACGTADDLQPIRLTERGILHTYTIVQRSFPGIATPFIAAVVDLDGGGALKGTLKGVDPEPGALRFGMPVRLIIGESGQSSAEGAPFISYHFEPEGSRG